MQITVTDFDQYLDHDVKKIKLTNNNSVSISVLTMGAILHEFLVPTSNGHKNLILSFNRTVDYYNNLFYVGMPIGRTAGRIKNGTMPLKDQNIHLPLSEGNNNHQGGIHGFYSFPWDYQLQKSVDAASVIFTRKIQSSEDGYPGDIDVKITFKLDNDNQLQITFTGKSNADTFFNPTCHAYFNLSEKPTILNHKLTIASTQYLEVDNDKIPTGTFLETADTPFDFKNPRLLKDSITALQATTEKGIDDIFKVENPGHIATLQDMDSGDQLEIYSKRNGLVVYTANAMDQNINLNRSQGIPYRGVALEAQTLPDTHNHKDFGNISLPADKEQSYTIGYRFTERKN